MNSMLGGRLDYLLNDQLVIVWKIHKVTENNIFGFAMLRVACDNVFHSIIEQLPIVVNFLRRFRISLGIHAICQQYSTHTIYWIIADFCSCVSYIVSVLTYDMGQSQVEVKASINKIIYICEWEV